MSSPSQSLMARIEQGDLDALQRSVSDYNQQVWWLARKWVGEHAEDCVQDIFADVWRRAASAKSVHDDEAVYIVIAARQRLVQLRRLGFLPAKVLSSPQREASSGDSQHEASGEAVPAGVSEDPLPAGQMPDAASNPSAAALPLDDAEPTLGSTPSSPSGLVQSAQAALHQLPPLDRQILRLSLRDGCTHAAIALELGVALDTVKNVLASSLVRVLDAVEAAHPTQPQQDSISSPLWSALRSTGELHGPSGSPDPADSHSVEPSDKSTQGAPSGTPLLEQAHAAVAEVTQALGPSERAELELLLHRDNSASDPQATETDRSGSDAAAQTTDTTLLSFHRVAALIELAFFQYEGDKVRSLAGAMPVLVESEVRSLARGEAKRLRQGQVVPLEQVRVMHYGLSPAWWIAAAALFLAALGWWPRMVYGPKAKAPIGRATVHSEADRSEQQARPSRVALLTSPSTRRFDLQPPDDKSPVARGQVAWNHELQIGELVGEGLPANNPREFQYQIWLYDGTRAGSPPILAALFDVPASGEMLVSIDPALPIGELDRVVVTVESPGGTTVSEFDQIVLVTDTSEDPAPQNEPAQHEPAERDGRAASD